MIVLLKNFIGRPRPCFFQLCQYENTTSILPSGDKRISFGTFGVLGNVSKCHGTVEVELKTVICRKRILTMHFDLFLQVIQLPQ